MDHVLTKTALSLPPQERLELAQLLMYSVEDLLEPAVIELSEAERQDLQQRLENSRQNPYSGYDLQAFRALIAKRNT